MAATVYIFNSDKDNTIKYFNELVARFYRQDRNKWVCDELITPKRSREVDIIEKVGFSPGPWTIAGGHYLIGNCEDIAIQIATFEKDDDWEKEQTANKNIIAASLKMLKALIYACDTFEAISKIALLNGDTKQAGRREDSCQRLIPIIEEACYPIKWNEIKETIE